MFLLKPGRPNGAPELLKLRTVFNLIGGWSCLFLFLPQLNYPIIWFIICMRQNYSVGAVRYHYLPRSDAGIGLTTQHPRIFQDAYFSVSDTADIRAEDYVPLPNPALSHTNLSSARRNGGKLI